MSYKFENRIQMGFSDSYVERRISKNQFFLQLNQLIDWQPIEKELKKVYKKGQKERGTKAHNPLKKVSHEKRSLVASGLLDTFQKLWTGAWGVCMEHILRYVLLTLLDQPSVTLADVPKIILDKEY